VSGYALVRAVAKPAGYDRVMVGGKDVTFFRGAETVIGDMELMEPYAYGPTTLSFPKIDASLEEFGTGELDWIYEDAPVVIQRVDDPTAEDPEILATDYRGLVLDWDVDGRNFTLEVGGEASGPASGINMQTPLVRRLKDCGFWAANFCQTLGLNIADRDGPTTGIKIVGSAGGETLFQWGQSVGAWSQDEDGIQRAIMPTVWGGNLWGFAPKDTTTKHVTLFTDDARVVLRVRPNLPDRPNTFYGTGVAPDGERWRNAKMPGVIQGKPPEFPGSMSTGDTDADTTTGDGVTVLHEKLIAMGLLAVIQGFVYVTYTTRTARAVKTLQDRAGLTVNGVVNSNTWKALFDVSRTGSSVSAARIDPIVQASAVRRFDYTANGSIAGLNPDFRAQIRRKDRNIDFGPGVTKEQGVDFARGQQVRSLGKQWSGEIELDAGFGGFAGEWGPEDADFLNDPATGTAYIMSQLDILPGMNAWLPLFDGGILVHISGARPNRQARTVTLTVDTQARDLLEVVAINQRNKDAQRHIRREWFAENRASKPSGNMVSSDELSGRLAQDVRLSGGQWNIVDIPAGQAGTVNATDIRLTNHKAEFAVAFVSRDLTEKTLKRVIGNPLVTSGESIWETNNRAAKWIRDKVILYAAGDGKNPCGYFPRRHRGDDDAVTDAPITGEHYDAMTWPYIALPNKPAYIRLAIWPDRDCTLKRGKILYAQLNDVV
jgi:peptidoglycan hydrolase-like protein with peptidoglycan-binding domain